jgi:hypothetical protein
MNDELEGMWKEANAGRYPDISLEKAMKHIRHEALWASI